MFRGQNARKNQRKIAILDQWVEIRIEDGRTTTTLFPSNQELIDRGHEMDPPPELVYRRLHFPDGVPSEYYWAVPDKELRSRGVFGTQRMTVDTWLGLITQEEKRAGGHIGMTGVGNLPRPKQRGGCDCSVCTANQAMLDRLFPDES